MASEGELATLFAELITTLLTLPEVTVFVAVVVDDGEPGLGDTGTDCGV